VANILKKRSRALLKPTDAAADLILHLRKDVEAPCHS